MACQVWLEWSSHSSEWSMRRVVLSMTKQALATHQWFWLLLNSACTAPAQQQIFFVCHPMGQGWARILGGDTARTAVDSQGRNIPNQPRGYSILYDIMHQGGGTSSKEAVAQSLAAHWPDPERWWSAPLQHFPTLPSFLHI